MKFLLNFKDMIILEARNEKGIFPEKGDQERSLVLKMRREEHIVEVSDERWAECLRRYDALKKILLERAGKCEQLDWRDLDRPFTI